MPDARAHPTNGKCIVSFKSPSLDYNVPYVRADIAEQLAAALRGLVECSYSMTPEMTSALKTARKSLSAFDASNGDRQAKEARE